MSAKISELTDIKDSKAYEYYYPKNKIKSEQHRETPQKSNKSKFIFSGIILLAIGAFLVSMMTVFSSATVLVTPKSQDIEVSMDFVGTAEQDPGGVRYEVVKLAKSQTISVPATGEESVKLEAWGKIVVYNNFSAESQRLIVRTRFESPEGLVYRISESIIVPGKTVKNGVETPGSIEVEVIADEAGEKYNIKKTDFTIPGFKNDDLRYQKFYARSSTDMTGGFVGKRKTITPADKQTALQNLDSEIQTNLEKELRSKVPDGLTLLPDSVRYESRELPQTDEYSSVLIGKEITAYATLLDSRDLSNKIITEYIKNYPEWENIESFIQDFSSLALAKKSDVIASGQKIDFHISGKVQVLAEVDTSLLSQKLAGINKKAVTKLINEFVGIKSIMVTVRPIWKQSFPKNPLKINIKMGEDAKP